jgi:hypothetical protein
MAISLSHLINLNCFIVPNVLLSCVSIGFVFSWNMMILGSNRLRILSNIDPNPEHWFRIIYAHIKVRKISLKSRLFFDPHSSYPKSRT